MPASDDVVLIHMYNNEDISQRQLVEKTDLSLGSVNIIIHRLVSRGLLKIEKVNARQLRYILTPQGVARCTKKTMAFVKRAYNQIVNLQSIFYSIALDCRDKQSALYLFGDKDEIYRILMQTISDKSLDQVFYVEDLAKTDKNAMIVVWQEEKEKEVRAQDRQTINIIKEMDPSALM